MVCVHLRESWVACGDSIKKENNMGEIFCLHDQFWSNFLYSIDLRDTGTRIMSSENEDFQLQLYFWGFFSVMVVFFDEFFSEL